MFEREGQFVNLQHTAGLASCRLNTTESEEAVGFYLSSYTVAHVCNVSCVMNLTATE